MVGVHEDRFLGLPPLPAGVRPGAVVVPVPWERSTSYVQGTREGPAAILRASTQVELYDEELGTDTWRAGIDTLPALELPGEPQAALDAIGDAVGRLLEEDVVPLLLGGEHSLTPGAVAACARRWPDITVLQIDAHADLRDSYQGDRHSHACAMARVREVCPHVGVGIRALSRPEAERIAAEGLPVRMARDCRGDGWTEAALEPLTEHVYVTFDLDGLDPSLLPGVGTPEPGGLGWHDCLKLLRRCAERHRIVAADIVELLPAPSEVRSAFTAARLAYRLIGYALSAGGSQALQAVIDEPEPIE